LTFIMDIYFESLVNFDPAHGDTHSIQHYVIKFVSDWRKISGFLRVFRFPLPIKLTAAI
jgi:hypothetical protein